VHVLFISYDIPLFVPVDAKNAYGEIKVLAYSEH